MQGCQTTSGVMERGQGLASCRPQQVVDLSWCTGLEGTSLCCGCAVELRRGAEGDRNALLFAELLSTWGMPLMWPSGVLAAVLVAALARRCRCHTTMGPTWCF